MVMGNTGLRYILQVVLLWGLGFGAIRSLDILSRHMPGGIELHRAFFKEVLVCSTYVFANANNNCIWACLSTYVPACVGLSFCINIPKFFYLTQKVAHVKIRLHFSVYIMQAQFLLTMYIHLSQEIQPSAVEFSNSTHVLTNNGLQSDWLYQDRINYLNTMEMNHTWISLLQSL